MKRQRIARRTEMLAKLMLRCLPWLASDRRWSTSGGTVAAQEIAGNRKWRRKVTATIRAMGGTVDG